MNGVIVKRHYQFFKVFTSCIILFASVSLLAKDKTVSEAKQEIQKAIKRSQLPVGDLGLYISYYDDKNNVVLTELNGQKKFIPASLTKILTASALLDLMPSGHTVKTQILTLSERFKNGVYSGDLYLKGGGDPSFVSESLWVLVNDLLRSNLRTIEGNLIVDDTLFDNVRYDPGRERSRVDRAYDAPIGAMSFNWNSINLYIRPGEIGKPAKIFADPENEYVKVVNKSTTSAGGLLKIKIDRIDGPGTQGDTFVVSGSIPSQFGEKVYYKSITKPDLWSGYQLKAFLQRRGIIVQGKVLLGKTPERAKVLAEKESRDFSLVVRDMMKFSNNYVAEMLTKHLALLAGAHPATMESGLSQIRTFLGKVGIKQSEYVIENPSGLTRKNAISPETLHRILVYNKNKFLIFPEYVFSLPIAGVDGTLENRIKGDEYKGFVRAKTGRLTGVTGLAGYASNHHGRIYSFAFMYNGAHEKLNNANALFDQLAKILVDSL
ncbi:MAG: D-alanyl-D-alanine carboxypeptidase/D-alanyl-D-alanine-endopeptidase [Bdellovibrionales bacterium]|nr:D-alanyl-D-alanine carboxypeptidase/D-alanyl-D-alanine-endopeptidase [Bdellovibrionales bacterium]